MSMGDTDTEVRCIAKGKRYQILTISLFVSGFGCSLFLIYKLMLTSVTKLLRQVNRN